MAFFDLRVFDRNIKIYGVQSLQRCYIKNEKEKKRHYNKGVLLVESGSFSPLVFSINEEMDREASKCYSRIVDMLSEKRYEPYPITVSWIRRNLSFSLMRSIITCIRGNRTFKSDEEKQCTSEVANYSKTRCVIQE